MNKSIENKIESMTNIFFGDKISKNEQAAIFGMITEMVRQQAKTNELLEKIFNNQRQL